jgi:Leucine-rich repeat (LRR) protein
VLTGLEPMTVGLAGRMSSHILGAISISLYHPLVKTPAWDIVMIVSLSDQMGCPDEELTVPKSINDVTEQVKSLNISNCPHLTDLSNIGIFKNLETLLLNNNYNLSGLEGNIFEKNSKLKYLDVQNNDIEDFKSDTLKGLYSLEIIKLGGNKFKSVPNGFFANAPNLKVIDWTGDKDNQH